MVDLRKLSEAARIHTQIRSEILNILEPEMELTKLVDFVEDRVMTLGGKSAFPTGCSLNNVAAHYTPNTGDKTRLTSKDIVKIDFGVHLDGYIIDAAFSFSFDPSYEVLIAASEAATKEAINHCGADARFSEIGAVVEETIASFEMLHKGKIRKLKSIRNLCGHSIDQWKVHGGQTVPNFRIDSDERMISNQCYAIETFASCGGGFIEDNGVCSHYMKINSGNHLSRDASVLSGLLDSYRGLPFCRRWVDRDLYPNHLKALTELVKRGVVRSYPPLIDSGPTSQFERTIYVSENGVQILE